MSQDKLVAKYNTTKTLGDSNNCLMHSVVSNPVARERLLDDPKFVETLRQVYPQLNNYSQQELNNLFKGGKDTDFTRYQKALGPVLRQFTVELMRQAYDNFKKNNSFFLNNNQLTAQDVLKEGNDNILHILSQPQNKDQVSRDFLNAIEGYQSFVWHNRNTQLKTFDDYLDYVSQGNDELEAGDISILSKRYSLIFNYAKSKDPKTINQAFTLKEGESNNVTPIGIYYNGHNHFEYIHKQDYNNQFKPNTMPSLEGVGYGDHQTIGDTLKKTLDQQHQRGKQHNTAAIQSQRRSIEHARPLSFFCQQPQQFIQEFRDQKQELEQQAKTDESLQVALSCQEEEIEAYERDKGLKKGP